MSESEQASVGSGGNIYQRIQAIKREVHGVDQRGKHTHGFRFAKHDDVTHALSGLYVKHGVDREVTVDQVDRVGPVLAMWVRVTWVNVDNPMDRKSVKVFSEGVDSGKRKDGSDNIDGLASGKAISYAVKLAELKNFCLVGDSTLDSEEAPPLQAAVPTDTEFLQLCENYTSAKTQEQFQDARKAVAPVVTRLTAEQSAMLSKLDHQAKERIAANGTR